MKIIPSASEYQWCDICQAGKVPTVCVVGGVMELVAHICLDCLQNAEQILLDALESSPRLKRALRGRI